MQEVGQVISCGAISLLRSSLSSLNFASCLTSLTAWVWEASELVHASPASQGERRKPLNQLSSCLTSLTGLVQEASELSHVSLCKMIKIRDSCRSGGDVAAAWTNTSPVTAIRGSVTRGFIRGQESWGAHQEGRQENKWKGEEPDET